MKEKIEEVLRNRILFFGGANEEIPKGCHGGNNGTSVFFGSPAEIIEELNNLFNPQE